MHGAQGEKLRSVADGMVVRGEVLTLAPSAAHSATNSDFWMWIIRPWVNFVFVAVVWYSVGHGMSLF